jgi:hypothetical protein
MLLCELLCWALGEVYKNMCIISAHGDSSTLDLGPRDTVLSAARQPTLENLCASRIYQSKEFDTFAGRAIGAASTSSTFPEVLV